MKVKKTVCTDIEVEVEEPFYYKQDLDASVFYGRVAAKQTITIDEEKNCFAIRIECQDPSISSCYLKREYLSSQEEFKAAFTRLTNFVARAEETI